MSIAPTIRPPRRLGLLLDLLELFFQPLHAFDESQVWDGVYFNGTNVQEQLYTPSRQGQERPPDRPPVVALMLEANPNLGRQDIQQTLIMLLRGARMAGNGE